MHIIVHNQNQADKLEEDMVADLGLPWLGKAFGPGIHGTVGHTTGFANWRKHPTDNLWAYPYADRVNQAENKGHIVMPPGHEKKLLNATWEAEPPTKGKTISLNRTTRSSDSG